MKNLLFVGGGSLGHTIPAIAVAREFVKTHPDFSVHFVCGPRGETAFLEKEHLPYTIIDAPRLSWNLPWKFWQAHRKAVALLRSLKPAAVFSTGGYVSVPVCFAAKKMGIPIILHESDAAMGRANRLIARMARHVCWGFPHEQAVSGERHDEHLAASGQRLAQNIQANRYPLPATHFTGNPLRPEITQGSRNEGLHLTGFSGTRPILLIMGGSQGAESINEWTVRNLQELTAVCDVIHLTGPGKRRKPQGYKDAGTQATETQMVAPLHPCTLGYFSLEFAHTELPHLYACTDLSISRAGAGSITELAGNGIPSILIPLRGVAHDHQYCNATSLRRRQAAFLVTQNDMDKELMNVLKQLIHDPAAREILRAKIRWFCIGDSTGQIVKIIHSSLVERRGS